MKSAVSVVRIGERRCSSIDIPQCGVLAIRAAMAVLSALVAGSVGEMRVKPLPTLASYGLGSVNSGAGSGESICSRREKLLPHFFFWSGTSSAAIASRAAPSSAETWGRASFRISRKASKRLHTISLKIFEVAKRQHQTIPWRQ